MGEMGPERMQCQTKPGSNNGIGENRLEWKKIKKCFSRETTVGRSLKEMEKRSKREARGKMAWRGFCKE